MRFTVVDESGTISFVGPGHAMKVLTAACCKAPIDSKSLLEYAGAYDATFAGSVLDGLSVFDEHNTPEDHAAIAAHLAVAAPEDAAPFRVLDEVTRRCSLEPVKAGLVLFNLPARRIVQIQNTYAELQRQGRGRLRQNGRPIQRLYHYKLPADWTILP